MHQRLEIFSKGIRRVIFNDSSYKAEEAAELIDHDEIDSAEIIRCPALLRLSVSVTSKIGGNAPYCR
ncbi:hypothetical protein B7W85_23410 [Allorhizobium ampelinum]|nr:hypothetical protein B7W85_23410 [Allorhizobium ampelinum]